MSCGSVPTRFTLHNRRIRALKTLLSAHSRHVRFRQARNHLTAPMWDRMVPVTSASMLWHPLPTYNIGTLHHAAQSITACICKHAPEHNRLSAHNVREGTGLIRAMPCAHKLQHERAGPSRRGASNTSTRIAPISCANRCSHVPRVEPARQPRPDCPSEACFESLRSTCCGRAASLWIEPWMDSMSAAIFSALSIFSTTSSTSRPGWRMPKKRRHSHQRDDRDSAVRDSLLTLFPTPGPGATHSRTSHWSDG